MLVSLGDAKIPEGEKHRIARPVEQYLGSSRNLRELNLARVEKPSACLLLADSYSPSNKTQTFRLPENSGTLDGVHMRHSGHANAVFLDGHGEVLMNADDVKKTGTFWLYDQDTTLPGTKLR